MEKFRKFLFFLGPVIFWASVIFWFSSRPTGAVSEVHWQDFFFKKFLHVAFFGTLAALLYRALLGNGVNKMSSVKLSIFLTILYGGFDELHQSFTAGRQPTIRDIVFDTLGALIAVYILWSELPRTGGQIKKLARVLNLI